MNLAMPKLHCSGKPFDDWDAWQILLHAHQALDFPQVPFDRSQLNWRAKLMLGNALLHLTGGYPGRSRYSGSPSIPDELDDDLMAFRLACEARFDPNELVDAVDNRMFAQGVTFAR